MAGPSRLVATARSRADRRAASASDDAVMIVGRQAVTPVAGIASSA
jgi:hypothetical protein